VLKLDVHVVLRFAVGAAVAVAFAGSPQFALAQAPGSLAPLSGSPATGSGLNNTQDVVVSPDGTNVYAIGENDSAIAEFARNPDGSLSQVGCIADVHVTSSCDTTIATGLESPRQSSSARTASTSTSLPRTATGSVTSRSSRATLTGH
jgi:hypothetical protein